MDWSQVVNHGPFAALFTGMVLVGSLVNKNATDTIVEPKKEWCIEGLQNLIEDMPAGLDVATVTVVVIFPLVPIMLNSHFKSWNEFKFEIVKCHVLGQGSAFGVSELLRHFIILPEPTFLNKCNITSEECLANVPLETNVTRFCRNTNNLFDSLHHFPDNTCCFIGASLTTFLATLFYWNRINKNGKSIYDLTSIKQYSLIALQITCIILVMTYVYCLINTFDNVQLVGLFIGAIVQLMIICSTLPNKH